MIDVLKKADDFKQLLMELSSSMPEETAAAMPAVWPEWSEGTHYKAGQYCSFGLNSVGDAQAYHILKNHKASADAVPGTDPGAEYYKAVGISATGWPLWMQPTSNRDAYDKGDVVDCDGTLYISTKNNNTDDPRDETGLWELYTPAESDPDQPEPQYPEWVQPADKSSAYHKGDIVSRDGVLYISVKNNNLDDPAAETGTWATFTPVSEVPSETV